KRARTAGERFPCPGRGSRMSVSAQVRRPVTGSGFLFFIVFGEISKVSDPWPGSPATGMIHHARSERWMMSGETRDWSWTRRNPDHLPPVIDTSKPSIARVYDAFLGGKDNFAVD